MVALQGALLAECRDPLLAQLEVVCVEATRSENRLLVTVHPPDGKDGVADGDYLQQLNNAKGLLRSELACAITRKKVPELSFQLIRVVLSRASSSQV